ncbi:MAG: 16S rRNA (uracil(1498)-N(3))-methyltransferase [Primorskyibacter sp.]
MASKVRLFVDHPLALAQAVPVTRDQAHYLFGVMRLGVGAEVELFNGRDGAWDCAVVEAGKRGGLLAPRALVAPVRIPPDVWLIFAPIKKTRTDFIVEKAAEMGARRIMPVQTTYTNADRIRQDRLQAHAVEAAEQCGGTYVPEVAPLVRLDKLLETWPAPRRIMFCDEAKVGDPAGLEAALPSLSGAAPEPWAIVIGPEGGFAEPERTRLAQMPGAVRVSLGPRILRADTAAVAALTLWQQVLGDWGAHHRADSGASSGADNGTSSGSNHAQGTAP